MFEYRVDGTRVKLTPEQLHARYALDPHSTMGRELARQHADAIGYRMGVGLVGIIQLVIGFPIWVVGLCLSTVLVGLGSVANRGVRIGQSIVTAGLRKIR